MAIQKDPPLVNLQVSNPVTYLKAWWKKVMSNEGVDFRLKIHPITALGIVAFFAVGGFSIGRIGSIANDQLIKYAPQLAVTPTPTSNPWTPFTYLGVLQKGSNDKLYLITKVGDALLLEYPANSKLSQYVGKKILVTGKLNSQTKVFLVEDSTEMQVIIQSTAVPTTSPSPVPSASSSAYINPTF